MNTAFGNPKGKFDSIDQARILAQSKNIFDEYLELLAAQGLPTSLLTRLGRTHTNILLDAVEFDLIGTFDTDKVRDALCDIQVFASGAQHLMGVHADDDMSAVIDGVMTRFIKNDDDKAATIAKHAAKGVTDVYFEGEYPTMVMKSASDQPDAPKGKFMKSASFSEPVFLNPQIVEFFRRQGFSDETSRRCSEDYQSIKSSIESLKPELYTM